MPGRNRTGPLGQGPLTGRGAGQCAGYDVTDYGAGRPFRRFGGRFRFNDGAWYGWARGRMRGRRGFQAGAFGMDMASPFIDENESQAGFLQGRLDKIEKRLEELAQKLNADG